MASSERISVLIVDDRPENITSLEVLLGDMGLDLVRAGSGNEALRQVLHADFALVLLDVQMPEMDGFETAELMRNNPRTRQVPIIFITAGMMEPYYQFKGYEAGAVDYLMKPVEPAVLRSKVQVFCELFQKRRELERQEESLEALVAARTADLSRTAEELLQSKELYRRLLESIVSYVYTVTLEEGRPVQTEHNAACLSLTGFSAEEFQRDSGLWLEVAYPEDRALLVAATERLLAERVPVTVEHRIRHRDGSLRWVSNTMVPQQGTDGSLVSYDGTVTDITERKRLEGQLHQAQKMESIGRLAGGVAHEFNNMLSVILGSAELLGRDIPHGTKGAEYLEHIVKAGKRSSEITRQLLAFSRKEVISPRAVDLNRLISGSEKMLALFIGEDIRLSFHPASAPWAVRIDPLQLDQILMNLAANARDAMPAGGTLTVETANVQIRGDYSHYHLDARPGDYVRLTVSDTGIGMDPQTREQIFEPFFTTKQAGRGTGLGLSTLYGIVTQNGGFVYVYSEPGHGTTFKIHLPRSREEGDAAQELPPAPLSGVGTILLVEDEGLLLRVAARQLEEIGYRVIQAATPQEAIDIYRTLQNEIDLVLTDVIMPEMNGKEMVECIRALRPDLKVLFMSGYAPESVVQRGIVQEGMHYIQKPLDMEELHRKIGRLLSEGGEPA